MAKLSQSLVINNPQMDNLCFSQRELNHRISLLTLNDVVIVNEYYRIYPDPI